MKKILLPLLFLIFSQMMLAQTDDDYRRMFREKIELEKSGSSIVAVFVDEKGAKFINYGTLGIAPTTKPADETTIYEIGSITKLFVGVLLADAVRRGEVKLDDPISKYLPPTVKTPKFNEKEITLLDLATHTSGLPRLPANLDPKNVQNPYADYTAQNLYDFLTNYTLKREIGAQYEYSNLGFGLLGHILSLRTKMSLENLMTERIFKPLKMNDSTFAVLATKKSRHAEGLNYKNEPTMFWMFDALAGAGAVRTTSADMAKFIQAATGITQTPLAGAFADARIMQRQGQNKAVKIGLGWNNVDLYGTEVFWHGGGTFGFSSYLAIDPKQKKGAFLVNNSGQETGSVFLESVAFNFLNNKFAIKKPKPAKVEISPDEKILQTYVGEYELAPQVLVTISYADKKLFLQITGQPKLELFAEKEDEFFLKDVEASVSFIKDGSGKIEKLVLHQAGRDVPAKKIK